MFYFPLGMKTHFCTCLPLSTNNTISLQCKWSLISVILNIFAQSICISLHVHNMIPSDTLTAPFWSSLLTPTSATLWLHAAVDVLFLHSISLCARTHEVREDGRMVGREEWQEEVYDREEYKRLLRTARNHRILYMPMDWLDWLTHGGHFLFLHFSTN